MCTTALLPHKDYASKKCVPLTIVGSSPSAGVEMKIIFFNKKGAAEVEASKKKRGPRSPAPDEGITRRGATEGTQIPSNIKRIPFAA